MRSRKGNAPDDDQRKRTRRKRCTSIQETVAQIERNYLALELTPTATELVRLLQLQRQLAGGGKRTCEARWIKAWLTADE